MTDFVEGDIVKIKNPEQYVVAFSKKIDGREAVVMWVGPLAHNQFIGQTKVRFLKRNGRGKEFVEILRTNDLVLVRKS